MLEYGVHSAFYCTFKMTQCMGSVEWGHEGPARRFCYSQI
jgi:hypothetical protein